MRRWRLLFLALFLIVLGAGVFRYARARAQKRREVTYQSLLRSYSQTFTPGMTRKDVEASLRRDGKTLQQMCCMDSSRRSSAYDDLTKIGDESAPWFCSQHNVYIGFEFNAVESHEGPKAIDSDRLTTVRIFHWLEGCL
jgi:hypothetical protein